LTHHEALAESIIRPDCSGLLEDARRDAAWGVEWQVYTCRQCRGEVATVRGSVHWWNHDRATTPAGVELAHA